MIQNVSGIYLATQFSYLSRALHAEISFTAFQRPI